VLVSSAFDAAGRTIELNVTDDGPGVEPAELASIFDPFFRGSGAKATQGHGLGLAIARRVVEAHGGTVAASNRPSGGLAVTIRLPSA
jgi:two-component system OmpR family sensor kinase